MPVVKRFDDYPGRRNPDRWYVGGGMDATRVRLAPLGADGSWSLSTGGDEGRPFLVSKIDFECQIVPHVAIEDFEFFIASYVTEAMESTWVSAATPDGEEFRKLDCRRTQPWGSVFTVARDAEAKAYLSDGRWNLPAAEAGKDLWQDFYYHRPILVALDGATGLAVIIMVDPNVCSLLGGQHHIVETAHDFAFNADLKPEQPFVGRARLVIRNIGAFPEATGKIDEPWRDFQKFLGD